jgi:P4 family phage/plasmid primase-like protien
VVHAAIGQIQTRVELAKHDSDFTYFYSLLLAGEALLKTTVLGLIASLTHDPDRHRYRLEHKILRADGLNAWSSALDDVITGPASQFLLTDLSVEKNELGKLSGAGTWQFEALSSLKQCLDELGIAADTLPTQTDMKRWFSLFAILRNKTRGHGATIPSKVATAAIYLNSSITTFHNNYALFKRPWAHLYRSLSGKYRVTPITETSTVFDPLKKGSQQSYPNGVYLYAAGPRQVPFLESDADLTDFFFPNGSYGKGKYECLSYATDNKKEADGSAHLAPPGTLPQSETQGLGELESLGNCFSNAPGLPRDYVSRPALESEIEKLTADDRHPIITMLGRGGIGKTSVALKVLNQLSQRTRFDALIWFSARDVDLQLFPDDPQSVDLLQDWFGYCLTGDTSQHKMLLIVGPKRSGKGTIARVLTQLVGSGNVGGPTTSSLAGPFGLQPLIGKSLAIVSDARFSGDNVQTVVERLLCISGEDTLTIDRKHLGSVTMKLPTRFVFLTNELPRFTDASGALTSRFMMLQLTKSFYGQENRELTRKLLGELPGILNWAIVGWLRLRERGAFVQPESVEDALRETADLASPVGAFVRDQCVVGAGHRIRVDELYEAWKEWCTQDGRAGATRKQQFGKDLMAVVPGLRCRRNEEGRFYQGIDLMGQLFK